MNSVTYPVVKKSNFSELKDIAAVSETENFKRTDPSL